jgi:hypothetical protein
MPRQPHEEQQPARRNRRALDAKANRVRGAAVPRYTREEALAVFRSWQERFRCRVLSDSVDLIREDRER